jgi:hypothetical protein
MDELTITDNPQIAYSVKVLGDSSRLALDLSVGRLFRQTRVIASALLLTN